MSAIRCTERHPSRERVRRGYNETSSRGVADGVAYVLSVTQERE